MGRANLVRVVLGVVTTTLPKLTYCSILRPRTASLPWTAPGGASGSVPWNIVVLLTLLTLLPALLLAMTPFVRLLVVFHFLRQALGTQTTSDQSDSDWIVVDPHLFSYAAGDDDDSAAGGGALRARQT